MDDIATLKKKTLSVLSHSKKIRNFINSFTDEMSFVETDVFFSDNACGSIITGYATIRGKSVYILAQNAEALGGSFSKTHAEKAQRCIERSITTNTPLISIIDSIGAQLTEGAEVLEGYAKILSSITKLMQFVPHLSIIKGNAVGLMGIYATIADFIFMSDEAILSTQPPLSLAKNIDDSARDLLGKEAYNDNSYLSIINYKQPTELADSITKALDLLGGILLSDDDDPNRTSDALNTTIDCDTLIEAVADKNSDIEIFANNVTQARTFLCAINTQPVGILITNGNKLNKQALDKSTAFINFLNNYNLPFISLLDSQGIADDLPSEQQGLALNASALIKSISLSNTPKISVITNNAIGYSYVSLASKSTGFDYTLAFANAHISPITAESAPNILYESDLKSEKGDITKKREQLTNKYKSEEMSPYIYAEKGYIDNIIEPSLLRPYLASALLMLSNKENA